MPSVTKGAGLAFLRQLLCLQPFRPLRLVLSSHFPALPHGSKTGGDFVVV